MDKTLSETQGSSPQQKEKKERTQAQQAAAANLVRQRKEYCDARKKQLADEMATNFEEDELEDPYPKLKRYVKKIIPSKKKYQEDSDEEEEMMEYHAFKKQRQEQQQKEKQERKTGIMKKVVREELNAWDVDRQKAKGKYIEPIEKDVSHKNDLKESDFDITIQQNSSSVKQKVKDNFAYCF